MQIKIEKKYNEQEYLEKALEEIQSKLKEKDKNLKLEFDMKDKDKRVEKDK